MEMMLQIITDIDYDNGKFKTSEDLTGKTLIITYVYSQVTQIEGC